MREALYYGSHAKGLACGLCPKECIIPEGRTGFCRVRQNIGGRLYAINYGQCSSYALDPIEKKPLYHFYPGSYIFSIGTWGCNFACQFCQNWQIAQDEPETVDLTPEKAVAMAKQAGQRNIGIAYTYSEPSVWYEYILDTAKTAQEAGLKNVLVTNGFINPEPLDNLLPYIDAMNIDVKAFSSDFYQQVCAGALDQVKTTVERAAARCHVEVTTLIVPGKNDSPEELAGLARWLAAVNKDIPLHLSRYFPNYRADDPPTPLSTLEMAYRLAKEYLNYVYVGNVGNNGSANTYCPDCGYLVLDRVSGHCYLSDNKKCPQCGSKIAIVGDIHM